MLLLKWRVTLFVLFVFAVSGFAQLNSSVYITEARGDMAAKNYFEAIQKLDVCIKVKAGQYEAYFLRGVCKYFLNDNIGAEDDLTTAISFYDPYLTDAFHYRSFVNYRLGRYQDAINDINEVIRAMGDKPALRVERAFAKLANQDYNGAISDCDFALKRGTVSENLYLCKGMAENALTQYDSALVNYNRALAINPKNQDIYVRIGITYSGMGKYSQAIDEYNKALKIDTACTLAYYNRAEAYIKLNDNRQAMSDYNMVIKFDPANAPAYYNRGVLESDEGDYKDAIADFDEVLVLDPKNIQALFNRAKLKTAANDIQGAIADYTKTIEIFPYLAEAYYNRAQLKDKLGDNAGAKLDYNMGKVMGQMTRADNTIQRANDSNTLSHLSALHSSFNSAPKKDADTVNINILPVYYLILKDSKTTKASGLPVLLKKSQKEYHNILLTDKGVQGNITDSNINGSDSASEDVLLERAVVKTNMQLFNDAIKEYDKIITRDTACALAYFARGVNLCKEADVLSRFSSSEQYTLVNKTYHVVNDPRSEKYKRALTDFSKIIQMEPEFTYGYYNRAYVKYMLQDYQGAIQDYNRAIAMDPDFAEAYYNKGLLLFRLQDNLDACQDFSKAGELGLTDAYIVIKQYCSQAIK